MKNISSIKSIFCFFLLASVLVACEENLETDFGNFVDFELGTTSVVLEENATATVDIKVYASEVSGVARTYILELDEEASNLEAPYTLSNVTIPANSNEGSFTLTVTDNEMLSFVPQDLVLNFQPEAGLDFGGDYEISVVQECLETVVSLDLTFDGWAEECFYQLVDLSSGSPVEIASDGQDGIWDGLDNQSLSAVFCLAPGTYGFVVWDTYGDGGTEYAVTVGGAEVGSGTVPGVFPPPTPNTFATVQFTIN